MISAELRWLINQMRPYLKWQAVSVAAITAGGLLTLLDPLVMKWLIDSVLPRRDMGGLLFATAAMFVSYQGRSVSNALSNLWSFKGSQKLVADVRMLLVDHQNSMSADYHTTTPTGEKVHLLHDALHEIELLGGDVLPSVTRIAVLFAAAFIAMLLLNWTLTLAIVPILPAAALLNQHLRRRLRGRSERVLEEQRKFGSALHEFSEANLQIQLLCCEATMARRMYDSSARVVSAEYRRKLAEIYCSVLSSLMVVLGITVMIGMGGTAVLDGRMSTGALVAFYSYLVRLFEPLYGAMELSSRFQRVRSTIRSIMDALAVVPSIRSGPDATLFSASGAAELRCDDVCFGYRHTTVLSQFHLAIGRGARVALVGPNGAGKSTAAKLLVRLYDPQTGTVYIDNQDVRSIALQSLRSHVVYVPQDPVLFDGNIRENVRLGKPDSNCQELDRAAYASDLVRVFTKYPNGWQQTVGPGGRLLSGGERQRVAIARAVISRPAALVLDESTAALDPTSERTILRRIDELLPSTTLVFVSHRLSAITWVDRIYVLDAGRIVEQGSHVELYANGGLYAHLYDDQLAVEAALCSSQARQHGTQVPAEVPQGSDA